MKKKILFLIMDLAVAALLILPDQLTKAWAVRTLKGAQDIILIPGVFQLHYLENLGMAFGMLQNQQVFFTIMTAAVLACVLYFLWKTPENRRFFWIRLVIVLIIAGAIGNLIDRTTTKYVVDFLYFSLINFPVFNVADCYVTVSGLLLLILLLFVYGEEELSAAYGRKKLKE